MYCTSILKYHKIRIKILKITLLIKVTRNLTILSNILIQLFEDGVVSKKIQALSVRLPQKFQPWSQYGSVSSILCVLSTNRTHQQTKQKHWKKELINNAAQCTCPWTNETLGSTTFTDRKKLKDSQNYQPYFSKYKYFFKFPNKIFILLLTQLNFLAKETRRI